MKYQDYSSKGLSDTQREVRDLFKGIGSWKDGSKLIEDVITGFTCNINEGIQGWAKVRFPGSVNMRWKNCVLQPAAGRGT